MRSRMVMAARHAAMPFKSVPEDAAVAEVLGTLPVLVGVVRICSRLSPKTDAVICLTLVNSPCPISVPPWFNITDPSE